MTYGLSAARSVHHDREPNIFLSGPTKLSQEAFYHMTPLIPCLCFLVVVFLSGDDERLCFARSFKEPMILRHSCEKASEVLNDADFKVHKVQFVLV